MQSEVAPYKYVSVEGTGDLEAGDVRRSRDGGALSRPELGKWYAESNAGDEDIVTMRLVPERWRTYDYAKLFEIGDSG